MPKNRQTDIQTDKKIHKDIDPIADKQTAIQVNTDKDPKQTDRGILCQVTFSTKEPLIIGLFCGNDL